MQRKKALLLIVIIVGAMLLVSGGILGVKALLHPKQNNMADTSGVTKNPNKPVYYCPMHTFYTSDKPGSCPICGMDLVLKESDTDSKKKENDAHPSVTISIQKQAMVGIVTSTIEIRNLSRSIRTAGKVAYDPDLYLAQQQYLQGLKSYNAMPADSRDSLYPLVSSAERRLYVLGMTKSSIRQLANSGRAWRGLYAGSDSGKVWISISLYENDIGLARIGQTIELESAAYPGTTFKGKIQLIPAVLDPETRTAQAKAEIADPEGKLKAEMVLDVNIEIPIGKKLAVPENAVMLTGERKVVFVQDSDNVFTVRDVILGALADGFYEVISGLKEGDKVASSGTFFLDSEARLKSSFTGEERTEHGSH